MMVIGDAAGLVKPTTGGGIHYSILSVALAADVAVDALRPTGSTSLRSPATNGVAHRFADELEPSELRRAVTRLSDAEIDTLFELARTDGIMPIVRKTAEVQRSSPPDSALLRHPPARKILFRSMFG